MQRFPLDDLERVARVSLVCLADVPQRLISLLGKLAAMPSEFVDQSHQLRERLLTNQGRLSSPNFIKSIRDDHRLTNPAVPLFQIYDSMLQALTAVAEEND